MTVGLGNSQRHRSIAPFRCGDIGDAFSKIIAGILEQHGTYFDTNREYQVLLNRRHQGIKKPIQSDAAVRQLEG